MLNLQKFFNDFPNLTKLLGNRGISKDQLLSIKSKLEKERELIANVNQLRQNRNKLSQEGPKNSLLVKEIKNKIVQKEQELDKLQNELINLTNQLPNLPAEDTPDSQAGNRVIDVANYQHHIEHNLTHKEIMQKINLIDEEKSLLLSGSKFAVYQGFGSQLLHALINFLLAKNNRHGYYLFDTPYLIHDRNLYNTGQLPKFSEDLYKLEESNFYLIPTAEASLVNLYQQQILSEKKLPLKICGYSPCFRAEAGSAGQENKGLIRLHQFHKVELVKIVKPENSYLELEKMVKEVRNLLHLLKITHRVIDLCYEELGFTAAKTYDIEVWLPVSKKWLEISSCTNCEDFQARRAQIRVKNEEENKYFPHTLNGSALAIDRLIITLCEYYYDSKENQLKLPEILQKYFFINFK